MEYYNLFLYHFAYSQIKSKEKVTQNFYRLFPYTILIEL